VLRVAGLEPGKPCLAGVAAAVAVIVSGVEHTLKVGAAVRATLAV
jgi:hypothetical protein